MDDRLKENLTSSEHWTRFVYMLLFALFIYLAIVLAAVIVVVQFLFALITGLANGRLRGFGAELTEYIHQCWKFLMYNSEHKAFPFADWPGSEGSTADLYAHTSQVVEPQGEPVTPTVPPVVTAASDIDQTATETSVSANDTADVAITDPTATDTAITDPVITDNDLTDNDLTDHDVTDNGLTDNGLTDDDADNAIAGFDEQDVETTETGPESQPRPNELS